MKYPNPDMLLRIAQGDAYGAVAEYLRLPRDAATLEAALRFERYLAHPTHDHRPGRYTDDTQMSIAVAEVMLTGLFDDHAARRLQFAEAFVRVFRRDRRDGYARRFQAFLESEKAATGYRFLRNIRPDSDKNGAAMRAVPIGVLSDPREVVRVALMNASLTHDTPDGRMSSLVVALLSHFALYEDQPFDAFPGWVTSHSLPITRSEESSIQWMFDRPWSGPVQQLDNISVARATVHAVIHLLLRTSGLKESMLRAIHWGGDVDSVMAITWGIQSTRLREPLPNWLETELEDGDFGRRYLKALGSQLMARYA